MDYQKETDARIVIDDLLRKAGWDPADKSMVETEVLVNWPAVRERDSVPIPDAALPSSGRDTFGRADYLLRDQRGRALAVIEAKKSAIHPYAAKQQALPYAQQLGAPFIFLTNGELIYFWDYPNDDARAVNSLFSRRDLERLVEMRASRKPLATIEIPEHYIRQGETRQVRPYSADGVCRIYFGALGIFQTPSENLAVAIWHTSPLPGGWADGR